MLVRRTLCAHWRPLTLLTIGISAALTMRFGIDWDALLYVPLLGILGPVLGVLDMVLLRLPNNVMAIAMTLELGAMAVTIAVPGDDDAALRAVSAGFGTLLLLGLLAGCSRGQFGWGDVKLAGLLAAALAWSTWLAVLVAAWFAFGSAFLVVLATRRRHPGHMLAFGPFLLAGALVGLLSLPR